VLTSAHKLLFSSQETVTVNWLVSVLWFRQKDHLQVQNVLLIMLTNVVCKNDEWWWPGCSCTSYRKETIFWI